MLIEDGFGLWKYVKFVLPSIVGIASSNSMLTARSFELNGFFQPVPSKLS